MAYFKHFPKMYYDVRGSETVAQHDIVTNILARVLIKSHGWANVDGSITETLIGVGYFQKHLIRDGDRPDTLAHQLYGDSELHWLLFYINGSRMLNPFYDWPLTQYDLKKFITKKYGADINAIHHYKDTDGYEVDSDAAGATSVTNWIYEEELNDSKRPIRVLQESMVGLVVDEFKSLMNTQ
jgi:hypothetical protein